VSTTNGSGTIQLAIDVDSGELAVCEPAELQENAATTSGTHAAGSNALFDELADEGGYALSGAVRGGAESCVELAIGDDGDHSVRGRHAVHIL
jgi:hypothetical protein